MINVHTYCTFDTGTGITKNTSPNLFGTKRSQMKISFPRILNFHNFYIFHNYENNLR